MAITVPRPKLTWSERLYLPTIVAGMAITLRHFKDMLFGRTKVTMQYPEENGTAICRSITAARRP
jgi:NADH-quinone oxidoreductase subunit I